uniref:C2H2-type domain-containing protein n=3 Tax=Caenorhabditis japonica TaxID=281687 RepID=A0A8R1IE03_CAEJA
MIQELMCGKVGLRMNTNKTKFMKNKFASKSPVNITHNNATTCIEEVNEYVYPGRLLNHNNELEPELLQRRRAAWAALNNIKNTTDALSCPRIRAQLFDSIVSAALTYGSEVLSLPVICPSDFNGCQWTGQLGSLHDHLTTCQYGLSSKCDLCGRQFSFNDLKRHREKCAVHRTVCSFCNKTLRETDLDRHLKETTKNNETTMEGFGKEHEAMETIEREEVVQGGGSVGDKLSTTIGWAEWTELELQAVSLKERRKRVRGFAKFVDKSASVEKELAEKLKMMTKLSERQRDMVAAPVTTFCAELRERFEEVDRDKWQRAVMRMMRENHLENMGMLREACEKAGHSEGESAEPLKKEFRNSMQKSHFAGRVERENAIIKQELQRLEEEKKTAQEIVDKLKKALKEEKRVAEAMKKNLQSVQGQLIEARRTRETVEAMLEERDRRQTPR